MVVIFGTCWFPTNLINFLNDVRFAPMRKEKKITHCVQPDH